MIRKWVAFWMGMMAAGPLCATPQVVADSACEKYAVDIAAFATCENGRVTRAEPAPPMHPRPAWVRPLVDDAGIPLPSVSSAWLRDGQLPATTGNYLTAQEAHAAKTALGNAFMLIDVRDSAAFAKAHAMDTDANVPAAARDARELARAFRSALDRRSIEADPLIALLCRDGREAARVAVALSQHGFGRVFVVRGGVEGETDAIAEGSGWLASSLPMQLVAR